MTYELAGRLKDAGFPQQFTFGSVAFVGELREKIVFNGTGLGTSHMVKAPTLSELIEACGSRIFTLTQSRPGYWLAAGGDSGSTGADTPEEAVARLWLSQHSPK